MTDDEFMEYFYTSDHDGRLYNSLTDELASDEDWERWHGLRVGQWIKTNDDIDQAMGYDRRIGGGVMWSRDQRSEHDKEDNLFVKAQKEAAAGQDSRIERWVRAMKRCQEVPDLTEDEYRIAYGRLTGHWA